MSTSASAKPWLSIGFPEDDFYSPGWPPPGVEALWANYRKVFGLLGGLCPEALPWELYWCFGSCNLCCDLIRNYISWVLGLVSVFVSYTEFCLECKLVFERITFVLSPAAFWAWFLLSMLTVSSWVLSKLFSFLFVLFKGYFSFATTPISLIWAEPATRSWLNRLVDNASIVCILFCSCCLSFKMSFYLCSLSTDLPTAWRILIWLMYLHFWSKKSWCSRVFLYYFSISWMCTFCLSVFKFGSRLIESFLMVCSCTLSCEMSAL